MYALQLTCRPEDVDAVSAELWDAGTVGVRELDEDSTVTLIAAFETNQSRTELLHRFRAQRPAWESVAAVDWVQHTRDAWPARTIGEKFFLAPPWCVEPTPEGRLRLSHNPGLACGTGEHPCTQLALAALERSVEKQSRWIDVGTGSGLLAIAASQLGAGTALGLDPDEAALSFARENFALNHLSPLLVAGSADCVRDNWADGVVANISATVLLSILDELIRIVAPNGWLILTGFTEPELAPFLQLLSAVHVLAQDEWCCVLAKLSS